MKIRLVTLCFLLGIFMALFPGLSHSAELRPFGVGEKLVYNLTWFGVHVGTATLEVKSREPYEQHESIRFISSAKSNKVISWFFPIEDRVESIVDAEGIFPYHLKIKQRHGRRRVDKDIRFDQENREAVLNYKKKLRSYPIPAKVQDSLSSLYFFRTFDDLQVGESVFMDVHASKKNWRLEVKILSREEITVSMGTFNTIKTKAKVRYEGVLMDKGDITIWVTDDERKLPVRIKGKISIGPFTASISSIALPELVTANKN